MQKQQISTGLRPVLFGAGGAALELSQARIDRHDIFSAFSVEKLMDFPEKCADAMRTTSRNEETTNSETRSPSITDCGTTTRTTRPFLFREK
jgi:hypothetical protein